MDFETPTDEGVASKWTGRFSFMAEGQAWLRSVASRNLGTFIGTGLTTSLGKSTLCAKTVQFLRAPRQSTILFCFYSYTVSSIYPDPVIFILATLVSQILRQRTDLATYVYEDFVAESRSLSVRNLQELLSNLLPQLVMPRILIDGIDECIRYDMHGKPCDLTPVKDVLVSILQLESPTQACAPTKILIVSRDILELVGKLSKRPTVALDQESDALTADITRFATKSLETIREKFEHLVGVDNILEEVKKSVVLKSQGMSTFQLFEHPSAHMNVLH
jgi:hypothetical protein